MANFAIRALLLKRESSYHIFLSGKCMVFCGIMLGRGVPDRSLRYIYMYMYVRVRVRVHVCVCLCED